MSDSENEEIPKGSGGGKRYFVKKSDIFLTKNAKGETVRAITVKPLRTRAQVDFERLQREASRAYWAKQQEEIDKIVAPEPVYGVQKGRKQNLKDNIKQNMELEIFTEGFSSSSSDEEVCAAEASVSHVVPVGIIPTLAAPSTASLEGIRKRGSKSAIHDENVDVEPKIRKIQNFWTKRNEQ